MTYTSLEQRTAQGYLDVFPLFIPEESASVSIEEQKEFYDIMKKLYKLAYDEPQLFVPKLHEDAVPPMLFSGRSDSEQETLTNMKKFRKSVDTLIWQMYLVGIGSEYTLNTRQKKILAGLGIADFTKLSPAWEWMAKKNIWNALNSRHALLTAVSVRNIFMPPIFLKRLSIILLSAS